MRSLRARLVAGLLLLAAVGLIALAAITYFEQRSFLYDRVDQQLRDAAPQIINTLVDNGVAVPGHAPGLGGGHGNGMGGLGMPGAGGLGGGAAGGGTSGGDESRGGPNGGPPRPAPTLPPGTWGAFYNNAGELYGPVVASFDSDLSSTAQPKLPSSFTMSTGKCFR